MPRKRFIPGISKLPEVTGILCAKHILNDPFGKIKVENPCCGHTYFREPKNWSVANVCEGCRRARVVGINKQYRSLATSMLMIERYVISYVEKLSLESLVKWMVLRTCNNVFYMLLHLNDWNCFNGAVQRPHKIYVAGAVTTEKEYHKFIRYVVINIMSTNRRELRMLERNHKDISGVAYLLPTDSFTKIFGEQKYNVNFISYEGLETYRRNFIDSFIDWDGI